MEYREHKPPAFLTASVECLWTNRTGVHPLHHRVVPDGCSDIVFRVDNGRSTLMAVGTMTRTEVYALATETEACGIRFHPGMARPFLLAPGDVLRDQLVPLEELWNPAHARELRHRLEDATSPEARVAILSSSVPRGAVEPRLEHLSRALRDSAGLIDVDELARDGGLSPRQLRRRMIEETGLAPKRLARVLRFRRAWNRLWAGERPDWAAIALDCGYYDQSHLIRDFREFTGLSPAALARARG